MGIVVGYHLQLAGADVTYLIRPHRAQALNSPQILYSHGDKQLKRFEGYSYVTDPSDIGPEYDYIYVTLDGAALRSETGQALTRRIGEAAGDAKIILGGVFIGLRSWFLQVSGLPPEQVTNGFLGIAAYPATAITMPGDGELIPKADVAYADLIGCGIILDDSSTAVANSFAEIFNASGSRCVVKSATECALTNNPLFALLAACEIAGWPKLKDMKGELWRLGIAAAKEIQELSIHGEMGQQAAKQPESELTEALVAWEKQMLPFDLQAFNRFHHGGKVNTQDRQHLYACLSCGEAEGNPMSALKELIQRVEGMGNSG